MRNNPSRRRHVLAIDAGGTYFKSVLISEKDAAMLGNVKQTKIDSEGTRDQILNAYCELISEYFRLAQAEEIVRACLYNYKYLIEKDLHTFIIMA